MGHRQHGAIVLAHAFSHSALAILFTAFAIAIIAFFSTFSVTRKAQVSGTLLPSQGLIRVTTPQSGVVMERRVKEGDRVHAGDVLFVLSNERASASRGDTAQAVSSLLQQRRNSLDADRLQLRSQSAQHMGALHRRIDDLAAEGHKIVDQLAMQRKRVVLAEESLKRYEDLRRENFVSAAGVQDRQAELIDQQQRLFDLERTKSVNAREQATAEADLRDFEIQGNRDQEAASRNISAIEQDLAENESRRSFVVRATYDGVVAAVTADVGQTTLPNQSLAVVLPEGAELEAELYAPSRSAGFIKAGMQVLIRYQAFPFQKFGQHEGVVREVSASALRPEDLAAATPSGPSTEPVYRIRVRLAHQNILAYGHPQPLKPGMALDASVFLERRKLFEWILDPLYSIGGRT